MAAGHNIAPQGSTKCACGLDPVHGSTGATCPRCNAAPAGCRCVSPRATHASRPSRDIQELLDKEPLVCGEAGCRRPGYDVCRGCDRRFCERDLATHGHAGCVTVPLDTQSCPRLFGAYDPEPIHDPRARGEGGRFA